MQARVSELNEQEQGWVQSQLEVVTAFVETFSLDKVEGLPSLELLDHAWASWLQTNDTNVNNVNATINAIGIAFGQHLVDTGHLKWVIATDEHGSDLAVYGLPGRGDVLVYPANFVAKRYERREIDFLERAWRETLQQVQVIEGKESEPKQKPKWKFW